MATWDLWLDYHRRDAEGLTHGQVGNARPDVALTAGSHVIVGNEEADPAVAEVVRVEVDGVVLVRILPGAVDDNRTSCTPSRAAAERGVIGSCPHVGV